jgi:hypothetical protein
MRAQRLAFTSWLESQPALRDAPAFSQALQHPKLPPAMKQRLAEAMEHFEELEFEGAWYELVEGLASGVFGPESE